MDRNRKKNKRSMISRMLAFYLAVLMTLTMPVPTWAEELPQPTETTVSTETTTTTDTLDTAVTPDATDTSEPTQPTDPTAPTTMSEPTQPTDPAAATAPTGPAQTPETPEASVPVALAAEDVLELNGTYAIVSSGGKAMNTAGLSWQKHTMVQGTYNAGSNKITDEGASFVITTVEQPDDLESNEVKVQIQCRYDGQVYPLRTEAPNDYAFADNDGGAGRYEGNPECYIICKTGENKGTIRAASNNRYATIDNGELRFSADTTFDTAERFTFAANPEIMDTTFTVEHVGTGKYLKTYEANGTPLTVDGEKGDSATVFSKAVFDKCNGGANVTGKDLAVVTFISKEYENGIISVEWDNAVNGGSATVVKTNTNGKTGGWESMRVVPNGDGTVSFKDSNFDEYITVNAEGQLACRYAVTKEQLTENEKFIIHSSYEPIAATDLSINDSTRTQTTVDLSWTNPACFYTGIQVLQKGPNDFDFHEIAKLSDESSYQVQNLELGTQYSFKLVYINHTDDGDLKAESNEVTAVTRAGAKPATPVNLHLEENGDTLRLSWDAAENATHYQIQRAKSMFGEYETVQTVKGDVTSVELELVGNKYENYYHVLALNNGTAGDADLSQAEVSEVSEYISLETELFGRHTLIFAETDDIAKIDETLQKLFDEGNDYDADAQFKGEQYQVYFKPGDYTKTSCMYLGFYTSFNGLGKTPYDVKLNNIAIPAYLPAGALGGDGDNATCNFWRSAENLSIINTGNEQGKAGYGSYRPDSFNWAVAQAAPLRRVYSERPIAYDWNYGWASGGYVADCYITGTFVDKGEILSAGTFSGQQFYTRNSKMVGGVYGTTLNNFFQGVIAPNLLDKTNADPLLGGNGYTNWGIPGKEDEKTHLCDQQVVTDIKTTPKISEKPFLYIGDDGEYYVFVPAVRKNARGISWSKTSMGEGVSLPLSDFYIAKPEDTAAVINEQLEAGKNIYFTPGTYHAEVPIKVNSADTILLGTGMTSIIPDNGDTAMEVADVNGVRIEGLIFDAGAHSKYLLRVGEKGKHTSHAKNPIVLQDLFFRVGGTTDVLTKADNALEINSDDVIGDHFWIWRADHGAGVEWYGNESQHGLIVNGDNVNCYALFNEHFQNYHTLWNGENGATYFYQNETCYDPISQEAWMSHDGTVNGYSSYKVSNNVKKHYAVGLGIYNVFIYTGPTYDGKEVAIQLDNAIEVPNQPDVIVENACVQTFANDDGALQKINHIINGVGYGVNSGYDDDAQRFGESWSRKFLLYYNNGKAVYGAMPKPDQKGKFVGLITKENIPQPTDETIGGSDSNAGDGSNAGSGSSGGGFGGGAAGTGTPADNTTVVKNPDGTTTETKTETIKNTAGKEVEVTVTTNKDKTGSVTGSREVFVIDEIVKNATAIVTVEKNARGNVTDATAELKVTGKGAKAGVTAAIYGTAVSQITEAASGADVEISMAVTAGKSKYTVQADSGDLTAGNKLKVMAVDSKTGEYVLVNENTYKVTKAGDVKLTLPSGKTYELVTVTEAAAIEKSILKTVKAKKPSVTVKVGKTTNVKMSSGLNMDNVAKITYSTSKKSVATVNKNGKVAAKKAGTVKIKAKVTLNNGKTKTVTIKIKVKK